MRNDRAPDEDRRRWQAIFDNALDAILLIDNQGAYVDANPAACALLGYSRDELLRMTFWDFATPQNRDTAQEMWRTFLAAGQLSGEYSMTCKDGTTRDSEFRAVANILPGLHMAAHRDVSQRKQAEEKLRKREMQLAEAQQIANIGSWEWDIATNTVIWSDELYRIFGLDPQEFGATYEAYLERVHSDDRDFVKEVIEGSYRNHTPFDYECRIVRRDGSIRVLHAQGRVMTDAAGQAVRMAGTGRDITERRRAKEKLEEYAKRLQTLSRQLMRVQETERRRIAGELHDQIGQLLTALKFALERSTPLVPETRAFARQLVNELIGAVRELSLRLRPTMLDDLGLLPTLFWHFEHYTAQTGIQVDFQQHGLERRLPPEVETAAYRVIQEALTNIARHAGVREAAVRVWADDERLQMQIEDKGAGFELEAVRAAGPSSGLSGMHERAALLGGHLTIESTPGSGTRVSADLPIVTAKQ